MTGTRIRLWGAAVALLAAALILRLWGLSDRPLA